MWSIHLKIYHTFKYVILHKNLLVIFIAIIISGFKEPSNNRCHNTKKHKQHQGIKPTADSHSHTRPRCKEWKWRPPATTIPITVSTDQRWCNRWVDVNIGPATTQINIKLLWYREYITTWNYLELLILSEDEWGVDWFGVERNAWPPTRPPDFVTKAGSIDPNVKTQVVIVTKASFTSWLLSLTLKVHDFPRTITIKINKIKV